MIIEGDCLEEMRKMVDNSIDFIVTDPPYGLHFMGKAWDGCIPAIEIWANALRICKPGAMLAAFGGSRTHHHLMMAIEGGGWQIRDCMMYLYGSGFPKSHNFGKKLGGEWSGYGTALKPAYEPIILAMKPLDGTFAHNAEKWGVAGINIDESRIQHNEECKIMKKQQNINSIIRQAGRFKETIELKINGRWPANLILDEEVAEILGSPSRFFYCAKASSAERNNGCDELPLKETSCKYGYNEDRGREGYISPSPKQNNHPTVKPIALMKYIIKLLAPPGTPTLLDPFAGSGSTLIAAKEMGINAIGIEKEGEYCEIARKRIDNRKIDFQTNFFLA